MNPYINLRKCEKGDILVLKDGSLAEYVEHREGEYLAKTNNGFGLGEVAFVRWLVCRKAILPNPCYMKCRLIYDKAKLEH